MYCVLCYYVICYPQVIASLGYTAEEFDAMKSSKPKKEEKQPCVVCLDLPKETVFVDCGHMATCVSCAEKVTSCPLCRVPKTKFIRVFQS